MSDGIVFFGLFSQQFAGRFFSGRQIAGKGAKTGWFAEKYRAHEADLFP